MSETKNVAWIATNDDGDEAAVVFARIWPEARRLGAEQFECDERDTTVKRAPQYDDGMPTKQRLLADGWWFSCAHCERQAFGDEAVVFGADVFCDEKCKGDAFRKEVTQ